MGTATYLGVVLSLAAPALETRALADNMNAIHAQKISNHTDEVYLVYTPGTCTIWFKNGSPVRNSFTGDAVALKAPCGPTPVSGVEYTTTKISADMLHIVGKNICELKVDDSNIAQPINCHHNPARVR